RATAKASAKAKLKIRKKGAGAGTRKLENFTSSVSITNPQSNSTNALMGGNFTFTGSFFGVNWVRLFLLQAGQNPIDMGLANLNQANQSRSRPFGQTAPNPAPAPTYDVQAVTNIGFVADIVHNVRFV